jgi:hypothetical protein
MLHYLYLYIFLNISDDDMGYISDFSESEEEKDINYLTGDATKPVRRKGPCIIIKYVLNPFTNSKVLIYH